MKIIHFVVCAAGMAILGYVIAMKFKVFNTRYEGYGGTQEKCEDVCFSSPYYSACMNSCLQEGHADYMPTGDEYDTLGVAQVDDLDRGLGYDTRGEYGLRGETPGR